MSGLAGAIVVIYTTLAGKIYERNPLKDADVIFILIIVGIGNRVAVLMLPVQRPKEESRVSDVPRCVLDLSDIVIGGSRVTRFHCWSEHPDGFRRAFWVLTCSCGQEFIREHNHLINHCHFLTLSCGNHNSESKTEKKERLKNSRGTLEWAKSALSSQKYNSKKKGIQPPNITPDILVEYYRQYGHSCELCGKSEDSFMYGLHLDHCHFTGRVRGFLCPPCNTILNKFVSETLNPQVVAKYLGKTAEITLK